METNQAPPRRLTRSSTDRVIGGVCGGLADYTGLDPVIFRVVIAVAAVLGGAGLAAYLIAWLVIPSEEGASHAESLVRDRQLPRILMIIIGVLALIGLASIDVGTFGGHGNGFPLLVILGVGLWFWTRRRDERPGPPPVTSAATSPTPPSTTSVTSDDPTLVEPLVEPPVATPRRERSKLGGITLSATLVVAGILVAAQVEPETAFAVLLMVVGTGLLVGARYGRARGLIALGLVLTLATTVASVADVPFRGGSGERTWRPATPAEMRSTYRLGFGEAELDLRSIVLEGNRTVKVSVGMGELEVRLPAGVDYTIDTHAGFGKLEVLGIEDEGMDVDHHTSKRDGNPVLRLDARVGMGRLVVTR